MRYCIKVNAGEKLAFQNVLWTLIQNYGGFWKIYPHPWKNTGHRTNSKYKVLMA